ALARGAVVERGVDMGAEVGGDVEAFVTPALAVGELGRLATEDCGHHPRSFVSGSDWLDVRNEVGGPAPGSFGHPFDVASIEEARQVDDARHEADRCITG